MSSPSAPAHDPRIPLGTPNGKAYLAGKDAAIAAAVKAGFDPATFTEIPVQWGEQDANHHVNNATFFRYLEAGRGRYTAALAARVPKHAADDLEDRGTKKGLVVGSLTYNYLLPVVAPDTILVAHRLVSIPSDRKLELESFIYSFRMKKRVGAGRALMVGYDHKKLRSAPIPAEVLEAGRVMDRVPDEKVNLGRVQAKL